MGAERVGRREPWLLSETRTNSEFGSSPFWSSACFSVDCPLLLPPSPPTIPFYFIPAPFFFFFFLTEWEEGIVLKPFIILPSSQSLLLADAFSSQSLPLCLFIIQVKLLECRKYILYKTSKQKVPVLLSIKTPGTSGLWSLL